MHTTMGRNARGVTLMEIMLAVVILALSFIPIIPVMGASVKATGKEDSVNRAMNLCQEKLNTSLQFSFHHFDLNLGAEITADMSSGSLVLPLGAETIEGVTYTSSLTVTDVPGSFVIPERDLDIGSQDDPTTWQFNERNIPYANLVHSHKVTVKWVGKGEDKEKFYTLVTFRAKLTEE